MVHQSPRFTEPNPKIDWAAYYGQILCLWLIILLNGLIVSCEKAVEYPVTITEVKMERGEGMEKVRFYGRFTNKSGKYIVTQGNLEIRVYQNGQEFFKAVIEVTPEDFIPYGSRHSQFQSKSFETNQFNFLPKTNKIYWYDHTLKAQFWAENQKKLEFSGGYPPVFKKLSEAPKK